MQIQLGERVRVACAEAALSGATHDMGRLESGWDEGASSLKRPREEICWVENQKGTVRAEAHRVFAVVRVVSCRRFDPRRRTKLDLGSGESFDDIHGAATLRAAIKMRRILGGGAVWFRLRFWGYAQQLKAKRQKVGAPTVG